MRILVNVVLFCVFSIVAYAQQPGPSPTPSIRETVTVTAGTSQPLEDVSKTVNIIDAKELRERSEFSVVDTLRSIPGFRVQQSGGFGRFAGIKTRGLRNQDTAILLDGIRFRDAAAITGDASSFLSDFTNTSAFRIEVLRGSGSSLYGTNAIGGALDIRSQEPQKGFHGGISGNIGGLGFKRFRGNISDGFKKFGYSLGISRTLFTEGIDKDDDSANTNFNGRIDYKPGAKTTLSGRLYISDAFVKLNASPDTFGQLPLNTSTIIDARPGINFLKDVNDPDSRQKSSAFNGQARLSHVFANNLVFNSSYQGLRTQRRNTDGPLGPGFQFEFDSIFGGQVHTFSNNLIWNTERNTLTAGYEYESEKFLNRGISSTPANNFRTEARQSSNTFYAQDLLNFFNNKLQLSGSYRFQFFSLKTPTFSENSPFQNVNVSSPPKSHTFDGSAAYTFDKPGTKLRAHVGNGYRVPSLYERFGSFFFLNSYFLIGNAQLRPEKSIAFDAGIDQSLADGKAKLSATYFYTKIKDEIIYAPTDDIGAPSYYNFDKHFSRGAEFSAEINPFSTTRIFASYTFTNSDVRNFRRVGPLMLGIASSDKKALGIPSHQFSLVATQYIGRRFFVNVDFSGSSSYLGPIFSNTSFQSYTYRFKGNRKADISASYEIPAFKDKLKFRIYGTLENLLGYEYFENGFQTPGRFGRAGVSMSF